MQSCTIAELFINLQQTVTDHLASLNEHGRYQVESQTISKCLRECKKYIAELERKLPVNVECERNDQRAGTAFNITASASLHNIQCIDRRNGDDTDWRERQRYSSWYEMHTIRVVPLCIHFTLDVGR